MCRRLILIAAAIILLSSCSKLTTESLTYQSVRKVYRYDKSDKSKIHVSTCISKQGTIFVSVENLSSEIMTLDMTKSFVVTPDGKSNSFYDPTVRVTSSTVSNSTASSTSRGSSVNLGAVAGAFGVGGTAGQILGGITTGGGRTDGTSTTRTNTSTTYFSDMPKVSIAPKGSGLMPKQFKVISVHNYISNVQYKKYSFESSKNVFSICLLYSIDDGKSWTKFEQWFYVNSELTEPIYTRGEVNDALRRILIKKNDAINEPWWMVYLNNHPNSYIHEASVCIGSFEDYQ